MRRRPRRAVTVARHLLAVPLVFALAHCAGIVGIGDVPGGDGGDSVGPHPDGGTMARRDGGGTSGDVFVPRHDGQRPGVDSSQPGVDGSQPGVDSSQPGVDGSQPMTDGGGLGGLGYYASNLGMKTFNPKITSELRLSQDSCQIQTSWPDPPGVGCASGQNPAQDVFAVNLANGQGIAVVWVFTNINIDDMSSIRVTGPNPLILVALGSVDIAGSIDASADNYDPDGLQAIPGAHLKGAGVGGYNPGGAQGGGGGSFCGMGGQGSTSTGMGAIAADSAPGTPYGTANLIPLLGGSAGGGESDGVDDQVNGNGGGAIQISAAGHITVEASAWISANGSGGSSSGEESGTGGGSGGAILLEAPTVTVNGILEANGGEGSDPNFDGALPPDDGGLGVMTGDEGGRGSNGTQVNGGAGQIANGAGGEEMGYGAGGGGAGWIRINSSHPSLTGNITPAMGSACASQGPLP